MSLHIGIALLTIEVNARVRLGTLLLIEGKKNWERSYIG